MVGLRTQVLTVAIPALYSLSPLPKLWLAFEKRIFLTKANLELSILLPRPPPPPHVAGVTGLRYHAWLSLRALPASSLFSPINSDRAVSQLCPRWSSNREIGPAS